MDQTDLNGRVPRRLALKGAGVMAAALALPAAAAIAPTAEASGEAEIVHSMGCYHRVWSRPADRDELDRLQAAFDATDPTDEQRLLNSRLQDAVGERIDGEYERFIAELARHLPGVAPAIRLVAYHVVETRPADAGTCCEPPADACNEDCDPRCPKRPTPAA
jgi:hypothetical protein